MQSRAAPAASAHGFLTVAEVDAPNRLRMP
jgi:hypothetical protein